MRVGGSWVFGRKREQEESKTENTNKMGKKNTYSGLVSNSGLVTHAQGAAGHFSAGTNAAVGGVVAFGGELGGVHLGGGGHPQLGGELAFVALQELTSGTEVADVGHAGADEDFVNLLAGHGGQEAGVVGVVRGAEDGLLHVGQVDVDGGVVFSVGIGLHQSGVLHPDFHVGDTAFERAAVAVAFGDHPLEHDDVGAQVLLNGLGVQFDGASGGGTLSRGVGELKGLFALELAEAFNFQDLSGEDVDLAGFLDSQMALLDGVVGDGVDEVAQSDTGPQLAGELDKHGLGHVQGHNSGGGGEGHQTGTSREGDTDREASVGVTAGTDGVGEEHSVQPGVDDTVARAERDTTTVADEVGEGVVGGDVDGLGVGGSVAERLHDEVSGETEAGKVLEFVTGHGTSGIL